eukprot:Gregarina_sp_Pseudo_9__3179@NODE_3366_length_666_cov_121_448166_g3071_i0_p1_GENE_NODE_3366_length_666_cov_121_448166_g3071_i0NODE_3366_length_666_cov_121_448166_g3071_i0_p1_ORF_typecomplete_len144_score1_22_NODE_3366_length_666_cov_121_448166_g3071_i0123554
MKLVLYLLMARVLRTQDALENPMSAIRADVSAACASMHKQCRKCTATIGCGYCLWNKIASLWVRLSLMAPIRGVFTYMHVHLHFSELHGRSSSEANLSSLHGRSGFVGKGCHCVAPHSHPVYLLLLCLLHRLLPRHQVKCSHS